MGYIQFYETLAGKTGLRYAEVNFVMCQCLAFLFSYLFRWFLNPTKSTATARHATQVIVGFLLAIMAFSWGIFHVIFDATVCYVMILTINPRHVQYYVFAFSMTYMCVVHLYHQSLDLGVHNMDYIGPLMILTEKLSSLAYSIHDGFTQDQEKLNDLQKKLVVRKIPSPLEFYSFIFYVHGLLVGPLCFFPQYIEFIEGKNFMLSTTNDRGEKVMEYKEPSSVNAVCMKMLITVLSAVVLMTIVPRFQIWYNVDDNLVNNYSFVQKIAFLLVSIEVAKSKYFLAWVWGDAINNAAGLGFTGYDKHGKPKWDGVTNIKIMEFQTATSLKVLIDSWNLSGATWLRHVCFYRVPHQKTLLTFVLSAVWHGFYPGYFFTFASACIFVIAAKKVRVNLRHHFQSSPALSRFYDVLTWACTHLTLAYFIAPFTFLKWAPCVKYFNSLHWFLHIIAFAIILLLPGRKRSKAPIISEVNGKTHEVEKTICNAAHIGDTFHNSTATEDKKGR